MAYSVKYPLRGGTAALGWMIVEANIVFGAGRKVFPLLAR
jgi:hypothetical protein